MRFILFFCFGCVAMIQVDGYTFARDAYFRELANLKKRASFDLKCGEDQLETKVLGDAGFNVPTQMGVTGCHRRATYALLHTGWMMNVENGEAVSQATPSPAERPAAP
jgi:hypothetical protein